MAADEREGAAAAAYFRAIEEAFVRLRGAPLLLSPADFRVAARWHEGGVPLALVLATLEEVFARRRERGATSKINALRYCAQAVDAAWAELRELRGPDRAAAEVGLQVGERIASLVAALPAGLAERARWVERLDAVERLAAAEGAEAAEEALRRLDEELLAAAVAALDAPALRRVDEEVDGVLATLRDRFGGEELAAVRGQLRRQRLRREVGLPVLTLFG